MAFNCPGGDTTALDRVPCAQVRSAPPATTLEALRNESQVCVMGATHSQHWICRLLYGYLGGGHHQLLTIASSTPG
jgi:hypothetical protein